jgi:sarcosine oxidase
MIMTKQYDVIVLGLGAMGSASVYQLAKRGQRVLGLEQFKPVHDQGSSHGRSRIIRQAYMEHPDYVPLILRAYELWREIEQESGNKVLTITGGLMMGPSDSNVVAGSLRSAQLYNLEHEMLDANEIRRRFPPFNVDDNTIALYSPNDGFLDPELSLSTFQAQARKHGAELHFEEAVQEWEPTEDGVRVTTAQGVYEAKRLIVSAGAWANQVLGNITLPLQVERQVLYWVEPTGGIEPFLPDRFPIYIWSYNSEQDIYGFPTQDGAPGGVKIALHHASVEDEVQTTCTPQTIDRVVHESEIKKLRELLAQKIPSLDGAILDTATCMYTNTPDHQFIIDQHPEHPQVIIASPCSGHGFKFTSVIGEILADLAITGDTKHQIDFLRLKRF